MRKAWTLAKIYINSVYGLKGYINDVKTSKKAGLKIAGTIALILVLIVSFLPMIVAFNIMLYKNLQTVNQQGVLITNSVVTASMFTLVMGFLGVVTTYFVDKERDIVLSMPIKPWYLLFAKFVVNYITEVIITALIIIPTLIIYGIGESVGVGFYISGVLECLFIPLIPLALCYIVLIPIMKFASFLKKKDAIMILSGVLGIVLAVGIQIFSSNMTKFETNPDAMRQAFTSPNGMIGLVGRTYYPSVMATKGILEHGTVAGIVNILLFVVISVALVALLLVAMSKAYLNSNIGSDEVKKSSKKLSKEEFKTKLKKQSSLASLTMREIKLMNREPIFFMNGPMTIILMPFIIGVMFFVQRENMAGLFEQIQKVSSATYYVTLAVAGIGMFLGITGTPSSSAFSREGKAFSQIKAMPINTKDYIDAKVLHSVIIGVIASIVACILGYVITKLPITNLILAFVIANLLMLPVILIGLLIDITWPKLVWDNPIKAMKQNINVMVVVLSEIFIVAPVLVILVILLLRNSLIGYLVLTILPAIVSILLYVLLIKYGKKRFYEIEA